MARPFDDLAPLHGPPKAIVLDTGREGASRAMFDCSARTGVGLQFIKPSKPMQNAFCESLNGKFRDNCLNLRWFPSLVVSYTAACGATALPLTLKVQPEASKSPRP